MEPLRVKRSERVSDAGNVRKGFKPVKVIGGNE